MDVIKQKYTINAPIEKVWEALTNPKIIAMWGGGPAKMSDKTGFEFSFWGGDIWGKNIKVEPNKLLVQEWYGGKWEKPSIVTFSINDKKGRTEVLLTHTDLPKNEVKNISDGWRDYYLGPIKKLLEGKKLP